MSRHFRSILALIPMLVATLVTPVNAQDVEWTNWSKVEFGGALGTMMRLFGGNGETMEKSYIKGAKMRTDGEKTSYVVDLENPRTISIDHDKKTFTVMTFAQLEEYMKAMQKKADSAMAAARAQAAQEPPAQREQPKEQLDVKVNLKVERPGERQKIQGYDAERQWVIVETEATVTPEGGKAEQAGTLIIFTDSWNAKGVEIEEAQKRMAARADMPQIQRSAKATEGMLAAFTGNPNVGAALEKAGKELEKLEGYELKGTMHLVLVPPGLKFDREKALADDTGSSASQRARGGIGGMLRGALSGRGQQQQTENADPKQVTFARVRTEIRDIKTAPLAASVFEPPAGYREIPWSAPK